jgi:Na+/H+-translocating membrane pyrophosphatase
MKSQSWLNPKSALACYAAIFSVFIVWASLRTVMNPGPQGGGIQYLAAVEIAGAIFFLFQKTRLLGVAILVVVFAIAAAIEIQLHELPLRFVFYAASALFVQYLSVQPERDKS